MSIGHYLSINPYQSFNLYLNQSWSINQSIDQSINQSSTQANHLGLDLEATEDRSTNGCTVRNVVSGSAAEKDKRIKEGDFVIAVNNESLKGASTAQAKAILRRASLLGGKLMDMVCV